MAAAIVSCASRPARGFTRLYVPGTWLRIMCQWQPSNDQVRLIPPCMLSFSMRSVRLFRASDGVLSDGLWRTAESSEWKPQLLRNTALPGQTNSSKQKPQRRNTQMRDVVQGSMSILSLLTFWRLVVSLRRCAASPCTALESQQSQDHQRRPLNPCCLPPANSHVGQG